MLRSAHPTPPLRLYPRVVWIGYLLVSLAVSHAQVPTAIVPDGSLGTVVTPDGNAFDITGGTRPENGPNLFHSFGQFDVGTGATARFVGPQGIENIIGRVTGGSASRIDGRLQSDASLFLLNPSGLIFGPNATLDVSGSFHASTADVLHFADGAAFSARLNEKSTLTVASPSAFGFLGTDPAGIVIAESTLTVPEGETLSIVGGGIKVSGGHNASLVSPTISAPGGRINLVSVSAPGQMALETVGQAPDLDVGTFDGLGSIDISQGALISTASFSGGGTVVIRGGRLLVDNSLMLASTFSHVDGAEVGMDIGIAEDIIMTNEGLITTDAFGAGDAGDIRISAGRLYMEASFVTAVTWGTGDAGTIVVEAATVSATQGSVIGSRTLGPGQAGDVGVTVENLTLTKGAQVNSLTRGIGEGGNVKVTTTDAVTLDGTTSDGVFSSGIFAETLGLDAASGDAGTINVKATTIMATDGAQISSRTFGSGTGGNITVTATDIHLDGEGTRIDAEARGTGSAGSMRIDADRLRITQTAQVSTSTRGPGHGGTLTVVAHESVDVLDTKGGPRRSGLFSNSGEDEKIAGHAGNIEIKTPRLTVDGGRILSRTLGDGNAGNITIEVDRLELLGGAQIFNGIGNAQGNGEILGNPNGTGRGGQLAVRAMDAVVIAGEDRPGFSSGLFSSAQIGYGHAGDISISAPRLLIDAGGRIASDTLGSGAGGTVDVVAAESISISGRRSDGTPSGMFSSASASGPGGDIQLQARRVQLDDGASISAASSGVGSAGTIRIAGADTLLLSGNSAVTTEAAQASGGNIAIAAQTLVRLRDSAITATVSGGPETIGGNITVAPEFVVLEDSRIVSNANQGRGGNINIAAGVFLADPDSAVSAIALDSQVGIDGEVSVEAVATNLSDVVSPLPPDFALDASLLRDRCAAQLQEGTVSSLVARGRVSVPTTPEGILPSRLYQPPQASAALSETERQHAAATATSQWPRIINGPFAADAPVALECEWTRP